MAGPGDLFDVATELLLVSAEALDTVPDLLGTAFLGAPDRQFVSPGNPVHDRREQLAVWVNPVGAGARSPATNAPDFQITRPNFRVHATRCTPTGRLVGKTYVPPEAAALSASAEQHLADGWALFNHIFNLVNADLLFTKCLDMVNWNMTEITPSGGCVGWELSFVVGLDGYNEDLGDLMAGVRFVLNEHAIQEMFRDPDGMIGRDLRRRAINVESQAKLNASGRPGPNVDTGRLRSSITHELTERPDGTLVARIGTNVEYARYVEKGTDRAPPYPYLVPALVAGRN